MINNLPSQSALDQPFQKRSPAPDWADPWIPCCRRGKRLHHGGDICGIVVLVIKGTFRTIPTVEKLQSKSFLFPPEPL
jgi:hypothetical protein